MECVIRVKEKERKHPGITREGVSNSLPNVSTKTDASMPYGDAFLLLDEKL